MIDMDLQGIGMTSRRTRDRLAQRLRDQGVISEEVLNVVRDTPRHIFIDEALSHRAYEDTALPIGYNQTISQPYIVARMTELLLEGESLNKVLEVGTGSGYQTAVLAQLVDQVFSVERIRPLQEKARKRLQRLKLHNVMLRHTDGGMGWPEKAPFDGILVTAAPREIPHELLEQLAVGGRLVIPVGHDEQILKRITRVTEDKYETETLEAVRFVPLLSGTVR
ncbi:MULTISPECIES: protein-L-isoaspartate(D-aspartate) O-methyltransferase [Marinobacterium]|uniref:Protein-L-isoaspartate O-methyltransferase n=1 Tax=Marinobacterium iners DSM 11526 TaxID=1122198 RepID=A0A1H4EY13_9GAMM|nr:protein-L-isoaspartate(D-aspartate) O-methyltransferase [Marinobacterium iners]SEA89953.1 protein-L-isoaspartate(D-aspartate) O-methyltransferase [Marinobacterium iners DSM 11526]